MTDKRLERIEMQIQAIKDELQSMGAMRPGSLTRQYRNAEAQVGAFFQISYTHRMKSKTEYVRREFVAQIREQIRVYKSFKKLVEKWVALSIESSQVSMRLEIERSDRTKKNRPRKQQDRQRVRR